MILKPPENTKPRVQDPGTNTGLYMKRVTEEPESRGELLYKVRLAAVSVAFYFMLKGFAVTFIKRSSKPQLGS